MLLLQTRRMGVLLALTLMFASCKTTPPESAEPPQVVISPGQQLFQTHCSACHAGLDDPSGPDLRILQSPTLKTEAAFTALLRHPLSPTMPAFDEKTLDKQAVHELYTYLQAHKSE